MYWVNNIKDYQNNVCEESNITTEIESIIPGKYKDITNSYRLDKGQKDQYYDYWRWGSWKNQYSQ